ATGYAFADYLLGDLATWSYASGLATARLHAISQAYDASDTWKLGSKLTANIGLRYELAPPWSDSLHRQIVAQIPLITPSQNAPDPAHPQVADLKLHPVLVRAGTGDFYQDAGIRFAPDIQVARDGRLGTDRLIQVDKTNFAPRLGLSWSPTPNTVIRGGGGQFLCPDYGHT